MAGIRTLVTSLIIVGLISVLVISFASQFAIDNGSEISILQNPNVNASYESLQEDLGTIEDTTNTQIEKIKSDNPVLGALSLIFSSIGGVWKVVIVAPINIFLSITDLIQDTFFGGGSGGITSLVISVILGLLGITVIFFVVRYLFRGDTD